MIPKLRNIIGLISNKVDKVTGKDLSTNDFTDTYKTKLDGIATGATKNTVENSLTSTSTSNALSAAQGKALNTSITNLKPVSLYNNSSGTIGTITLSETAANFAYLEIFYARGNKYNSARVFSPNKKIVQITSAYAIGDGYTQFGCKAVTINGTSITSDIENFQNINNAIVSNGTQNTLVIFRVVGYR